MQPALEDPTADLEEELRLLRCQSDTEEAEEVTEKSDLDAAAEDRAMPLAFDALRHEEDIVGECISNWSYYRIVFNVSTCLLKAWSKKSNRGG